LADVSLNNSNGLQKETEISNFWGCLLGRRRIDDHSPKKGNFVALLCHDHRDSVMKILLANKGWGWMEKRIRYPLRHRYDGPAQVSNFKDKERKWKPSGVRRRVIASMSGDG
jgi:hypothetical protein